MAEITVLIAEDEAHLAELVALNLRQAGFLTRLAPTGPLALSAILAALDGQPVRPGQPPHPDAVLLDLMLPGLSGEEIMKRVRAHPNGDSLPVIMLTAKGSEDDQVTGLELGADDYLAKPVSMKILVARLNALLRRTDGPVQGDAASLTSGGIRIDTGTHECFVDGVPTSVTLTEFRLLTALIEAEGRVLSRADLMTKAMGPGVTVTERTIDVHMTSIRKKLGDYAPVIKTVRGVGYRLLGEEVSPR